MAIKWRDGRYNNSRAELHGLSMGINWVGREEQYAATCDSLGIRLTGFGDHQSAQRAIEQAVADRLRLILVAMEAK